MKKSSLYILMIILSLFVITGCNSQKIESKNEVEKRSDTIKSVSVVIKEKEYILNLEDSETAKEFVSMLPIDLDMSELNGNEKYINLDKNLKTNPYNPKRINAGDVMLYGDNCLVIFYKSFDTTYSYTKIGHIDNLDDLGNGDIKVRFEK